MQNMAELGTFSLENLFLTGVSLKNNYKKAQ